MVAGSTPARGTNEIESVHWPYFIGRLVACSCIDKNQGYEAYTC